MKEYWKIFFVQFWKNALYSYCAFYVCIKKKIQSKLFAHQSWAFSRPLFLPSRPYRAADMTCVGKVLSQIVLNLQYKKTIQDDSFIKMKHTFLFLNTNTNYFALTMLINAFFISKLLLLIFHPDLTSQGEVISKVFVQKRTFYDFEFEFKLVIIRKGLFLS